MTNEQLYLAIGLPIIVNMVFNTILFVVLGARINDVGVRLTSLENHMNARFDDMKDLWRSELKRVEEVLDARLKHLEERIGR